MRLGTSWNPHGIFGEGGEEKFWEVEEAINVEDEESPPRKVLRDPGEPTKAEWDAHRVDHIPYRSWCPHCVKERATGRQHRKIDEEPTVPTFGFDYLQGADLTGEPEEEEGFDDQLGLFQP